MPSGTYSIFGPLTVRQDPSIASRHRDEIVVGDADVTGVQVVAPYRVPVVVVVDGRDRTGDATVPRPSFWRNNADGTGGSGIIQPRVMYLQDGDRVSAGPLPPGYRIDAVAHGGVDLRRDPIRLDGVTPGEIRVVVSTTPPDPGTPEFTLSGRVIGRGPSTAPRRVILIYGDYDTAIETAIDADGAFRFSRIPSGRYELRADGQLPGARIVVSGADVSGIVLRAGP